MGMCKFSNLTGKGMCRGLCDYFHLFPSKMNMNHAPPHRLSEFPSSFLCLVLLLEVAVLERSMKNRILALMDIYWMFICGEMQNF